MKAVLFVAGIVMLTAACNKKEDGPTLDFNITVPSDWKYYVLSSNNVVYYAQSPQKTTTDSQIKFTASILKRADFTDNIPLGRLSVPA